MAFRDLIEQRLHASATTWRQVASTLGVHRQLLDPAGVPGYDFARELRNVPFGVLADLARLLDLPLEEFIEAITGTEPGGTHGSGTEDSAVSQGGPGAATDATALLAALAHARTPLAVDDLAEALDWSTDRALAAHAYLAEHPEICGPYAIDGHASGTLAAHLRQDLLTIDQYDALRDAVGAQHGMAVEEAAVVCILANVDAIPRYDAECVEFLDTHEPIIRELQRRGIAASAPFTDFGALDDAVRYSLGVKKPGDRALRTPRWAAQHFPDNPDPGRR